MNDVELFQQFCLLQVNKEVRKHFSDVEEVAEIPVSGRGLAKAACLHKDNDPVTLTTARLLAFYFVCGNWDNEAFYGIPITTFHETHIFQPQVVLHFREKMSDMKAAGRKRQLKAQVGYRIRDTNFTMADAERVALEIKQKFATGTKYKFRKGEVKVSYRDKPKGYEFILTVFNETEAKELITKVLQLQDDIPDWEKLTNSESGRNFKTTGKQTILGKQFDKPRYRQIGYVQFTHAELKIHGMSPDVILVDTALRYPRALQKGFL